MIIDVVQTSKEQFTADFAIKRGAEQIGEIALKGKPGSMEAEIQVRFNDKYLRLSHGKFKSEDRVYMFRPYRIYEGNSCLGAVYQTKFNAGLFKSFDFYQMKLNGLTYELFPIAFGKEGGKSPVYNGSRQTAQINKDCVVYNDLHNYKIFAEDTFSGQIAVLFSIYMYIISAFEPGRKVIKSKEVFYSKTKNKLLEEKYNPEFVKRIED